MTHHVHGNVQPIVVIGVGKPIEGEYSRYDSFLAPVHMYNINKCLLQIAASKPEHLYVLIKNMPQKEDRKFASLLVQSLLCICRACAEVSIQDLSLSLLRATDGQVQVQPKLPASSRALPTYVHGLVTRINFYSGAGKYAEAIGLARSRYIENDPNSLGTNMAILTKLLMRIVTAYLGMQIERANAHLLLGKANDKLNGIDMIAAFPLGDATKLMRGDLHKAATWGMTRQELGLSYFFHAEVQVAQAYSCLVNDANFDKAERWKRLCSTAIVPGSSSEMHLLAAEKTLVHAACLAPLTPVATLLTAVRTLLNRPTTKRDDKITIWGIPEGTRYYEHAHVRLLKHTTSCTHMGDKTTVEGWRDMMKYRAFYVHNGTRELRVDDTTRTRFGLELLLAHMLHGESVADRMWPQRRYDSRNTGRVSGLLSCYEIKNRAVDMGFEAETRDSKVVNGERFK